MSIFSPSFIPGLKLFVFFLCDLVLIYMSQGFLMNNFSYTELDSVQLKTSSFFTQRILVKIRTFQIIQKPQTEQKRSQQITRVSQHYSVQFQVQYMIQYQYRYYPPIVSHAMSPQCFIVYFLKKWSMDQEGLKLKNLLHVELSKICTKDQFAVRLHVIVQSLSAMALASHKTSNRTAR